MELTQLTWLAGLLEGEACFFLSHGNSPAIVVKMKDKDVIEKAHSLMGGNLRCTNPQPKYPQWSILWAVELFGEPAMALMRELLPHMGIRRAAKIAEVLKLREENKVRSAALRKKQRKEYWANPENRAKQSIRLKKHWEVAPEEDYKRARANGVHASKVRWSKHGQRGKA